MPHVELNSFFESSKGILSFCWEEAINGSYGAKERLTKKQIELRFFTRKQAVALGIKPRQLGQMAGEYGAIRKINHQGETYFYKYDVNQAVKQIKEKEAKKKENKQ